MARTGPERVGVRLTAVNFASGLLGTDVGRASARATIHARAVAASNIVAPARGANLVALTLTGFRPLGDRGRLSAVEAHLGLARKWSGRWLGGSGSDRDQLDYARSDEGWHE